MSEKFNPPKSLPTWEEIPKEFKESRNKYSMLADRWFCLGLAKGDLIAKEGIPLKEASIYLRAHLHWFGYSHEHKIAGVAYLMSQWFEIGETGD